MWNSQISEEAKREEYESLFRLKWEEVVQVENTWGWGPGSRTCLLGGRYEIGRGQIKGCGIYTLNGGGGGLGTK